MAQRPSRVDPAQGALTDGRGDRVHCHDNLGSDTPGTIREAVAATATASAEMEERREINDAGGGPSKRHRPHR